eukprot:UN02005
MVVIFSFGLKVPHYLAVLFLVNASGWYFYYQLEDEPNQPTKPYFQIFKLIYERIELVTISKIILFSFWVHIFAYISNTAVVDVQRQFAHVTPLYDGLVSQILSYLAMSLAIFATKKYLLNVSWHKILFVCIIGMSVLTYIPNILITFNIIRHPAFATISTLLPTFIQGVFFIVSSLSAVECATPETASITFGLMTTINNLTLPLTTLLSNRLVSFFAIYGADGRTLLDTTASRFELFKLDTTVFFLQLAALFTLLLLPKQKRYIQEGLQKGERSAVLPKVIVVGFVICFLYSLIGNMASSSAKLNCMPLFGGKGCHE